jgi:WD40 repeat protein
MTDLRVVAAFRDGTVRSWDLATDQAGAEIGSPRGATRLALTPDGSRLAAVDVGGAVTLYETGGGTPVKQFAGLSGEGTAVAVHRDGTRLAAAAGSAVNVWDAGTGAVLQTLTAPGPVAALGFSPNGAHLAVGTRNNTTTVWRIADGRRLLDNQGHSNVVTGVAFRADGRYLYTTSFDTMMKVRKAPPGGAD